MDLISVDFETYYDKAYSLKKLTTEAYIRDDRFEVMGVGVKLNDSKTQWYTGTHSQVAEHLSKYDWKNSAVLAHHTAFDGAILAWHFGHIAKFYFDTVSMARPLHAQTIGVSLKALAEEYGVGVKGDEVHNAEGVRRGFALDPFMIKYARYCIKDVDLTHALFLKLKKLIPASELMVIDTTLRMFIQPKILIDTKTLSTHLAEIQNEKAELMEAAGVSDRSDLLSNEKFAALLVKEGVVPPKKTSPTTKKPTYAFAKTDKGMTALLAHSRERVRALVRARLNVKSTIGETRTKSLIDIGHRGPLPIMLNYYGAHTGRFSGGDKINLQNFPRKSTLRRSLVAPKGKVLLACDSSQIEARMVAWLAGQIDLLESFRAGNDVYSEFASKLYGRMITKEDILERFVGKTCILGLGYGMGHIRFLETLASGGMGMTVDMSLHEANTTVRIYRTTYAYIVQLWKLADALLTNMGSGRGGILNNKLEYSPEGIVLPNNLKIKYPLLQKDSTPGSSNWMYCDNPRLFAKTLRNRVLNEADDTNDPNVNMTFLYGAKVVENIVQALARIVVAEQMVEIRKAGHDVLFQVHDENVIMCDENKAEEISAEVVDIMSRPPSWAPDLPVACEASYGYNYGDCK